MREKSTATEDAQVDSVLRAQIEMFVQNTRTNLTKHLLKAVRRLTDRGVSSIDAIAVVRSVYEATKTECEKC